MRSNTFLVAIRSTKGAASLSDVLFTEQIMVSPASTRAKCVIIHINRRVLLFETDLDWPCNAQVVVPSVFTAAAATLWPQHADSDAALRN